MMDNKPIFEYSDLELKAMGFDILDQMELLQKNLSLIRIEISRRNSSKVLSSVTQESLDKMLSDPHPNGTQDLLTPLNK